MEKACEICREENAGNPCSGCGARLYEFYVSKKIYKLDGCGRRKFFAVEKGCDQPPDTIPLDEHWDNFDISHQRGVKLNDHFILLFRDSDDCMANIATLIRNGWCYI